MEPDTRRNAAESNIDNSFLFSEPVRCCRSNDGHFEPFTAPAGTNIASIPAVTYPQISLFGNPSVQASATDTAASAVTAANAAANAGQAQYTASLQQPQPSELRKTGMWLQNNVIPEGQTLLNDIGYTANQGAGDLVTLKNKVLPSWDNVPLNNQIRTIENELQPPPSVYTNMADQGKNQLINQVITPYIYEQIYNNLPPAEAATLAYAQNVASNAEAVGTGIEKTLGLGQPGIIIPAAPSNTFLCTYSFVQPRCLHPWVQIPLPPQSSCSGV